MDTRNTAKTLATTLIAAGALAFGAADAHALGGNGPLADHVDHGMATSPVADGDDLYLFEADGRTFVFHVWGEDAPYLAGYEGFEELEGDDWDWAAGYLAEAVIDTPPKPVPAILCGALDPDAGPIIAIVDPVPDPVPSISVNDLVSGWDPGPGPIINGIVDSPPKPIPGDLVGFDNSPPTPIPGSVIGAVYEIPQELL